MKQFALSNYFTGMAFLLLMGGALAACSSSQNLSHNTPMMEQNVTNTNMMAPVVAEGEKENIPSAPIETPLCGTALHERAQADEKIYMRSLQSGSSCVVNACFQPLTGTYISENGNNVVCR